MSHQFPLASPPSALTIAGSDSGGGAGIQADLKTFAAFGVYGLSAITAITAQNTLGIRSTFDLSADLVAAQIDAVIEDIGVGAAKTGMLANSAIVATVAKRVQYWNLRLVVDPVMIATSGHTLLQAEARSTFCAQLLPFAEVITPNLDEAAAITGRPVSTIIEMREAARAIHAMGPRHVVVKGGHLTAAPIDVYFDGSVVLELPASRIATRHTHGTGCAFSAAITALLVRGASPREAVIGAKEYIIGAIQFAPGIGQGNGPIGHFWRQMSPGVSASASMQKVTSSND